MSCKNLSITIFVFAVILTCRGENCESYDENGTCAPPCSDGKVLYSAGCLDPTLSERTCRNPVARSLGVRCDYSRCECPNSKVWDEAAKKCVNVAECIYQSNETTTNTD